MRLSWGQATTALWLRRCSLARVDACLCSNVRRMSAARPCRPYPSPALTLASRVMPYLVSLFPRPLLSALGIDVELRRRRVSSYTPCGDAGVLVCDDARRTRASIARTLGEERTATALERFAALTAGVAERVFPTLTNPLPRAPSCVALIGDEEAWPRGVRGAVLGAAVARALPRDWSSWPGSC